MSQSSVKENSVTEVPYFLLNWQSFEAKELLFPQNIGGRSANYFFNGGGRKESRTYE